ncbi:decarboxylase [Staphylococcus pseudoxylosus]|uniref:decarboxylase n=1 Tax=Staphylococcus pseudoxylosus TaxID=2282419 RepID=UPI001F3BAF98|nr:decarboxylase [Staphylococcus pseudoxylosus]MCE5003512.1 decarboxylase [Staphylococcus pseudoxylosus]
MIFINIYKKYAETFGTPLYIYDFDIIYENYKKLKHSLPYNSYIYYSLKANSNDLVVKKLIEIGAGAEVSSLNELDISINAGLNKNKLLYTGPGKTDDEINYIISKNVGYISVESLEELKQISFYSNKQKIETSILIRLNPDNNQMTNASIKMTSSSSQFGIDISNMPECLEIIQYSPYIKFSGFHLFNGSNLNNEGELLENFLENIKISHNLSKKFGLPTEIIDIGGGFPAPYGKKGNTIDFHNLKVPIENELKNLFGDSPPKLIFESGRYIVGTSGTLLGEVQVNKKTKETNFLVLNFGINTISGMSAIGRLPSLNYDFETYAFSDEKLQYRVVGPLCTPMDYLSRKINLPELYRGDLITIPNVGAYSLSASLINFLSRDLPVELVLEKNHIISASKINILRKEMDIKGGD